MGAFRFLVFFLGVLGVLTSCRSGDTSSIEIPQWKKGDTLTQVDTDILLLTEAIQENPGIAENYYQRARLFLQQKKWDTAQVDLQKALSIRPNVGKYLLLLGQTWVEKGQFQTALTALLKAESLNYSNSALFLMQARAYAGLNDGFNAQNSLAKALQMNPLSGEPYAVQAEIKLLTKDSLGAIANWKKVIQFAPHDVVGYQKLIGLYQSKKWNDSVLTLNDRAIRLFPDSVTFQLTKAKTLASFFLLDSAVVVYGQILRKNPKQVDALWQLGAIHLRKNRPELALACYRSALSLSKDKVDAYVKAGDLAETIKKHPEALSIYELGLKNHPGNYNLELGVERVKQKLYYINEQKTRWASPKPSPVVAEPEPTTPGKPEWRDIKPIRNRTVIFKKDSSAN